jgi:hypothetical protein
LTPHEIQFVTVEDDVNEITTEAQARAFEVGVPCARVVRLPYASHYILASHETEVLREMNSFISTLP